MVEYRYSAPVSDLITSLPGIDFDINYLQYSGYLNGTTGNHLHYWFVESQGEPHTDPLVLWLNGGPGCSSLDGLLNENGPIHMHLNGTLYSNPYSWNQLANVLYLESPAGVGFSYSDRRDYDTNDDQVGHNNYLALQDFLARFPEFEGRDLYLTGESYAGVYVPTLAVRVLNGTLPVNFQGFAIGNPLLSSADNDNSLMFYARYHGLIGQTLWAELVTNCCHGNESAAACNFASPRSFACITSVLSAEEQIELSGLNVYNILSPCTSSDVITPMTLARRHLLTDVTRAASHTRSRRAVGMDPECTDSSAIREWINSAEVRKSLHIPDQAPRWSLCSERVSISYDKQYNSMRAQFTELLPSVRALIYNGDLDIACNFLGDQWFVESLGREVVKSYSYWTINGTVAGYSKSWDQLTFTTIRGSGHMVPQDKPLVALEMFRRFLDNEPF